MSSKSVSEDVISLTDVGKCYQIYHKPHHRLLQMLMRGRRSYYKEFWALNNINLNVQQGDIVGIMGVNGAGKSTLLQLVCGTLLPSHGEVKVSGRIAALLELGAGFNPEFTGRENVYLSATISGMTKEQIDGAFDSIVEFAGIEPFIDQPVKTYSSGMYVRLAFSVAINVDPDILVIDEALSVGDGEFSRKSFDRIMQLKDAGKTILFCSHALYQIEAICNKALWIHNGKICHIGDPAGVIIAYNRFLESPKEGNSGVEFDTSASDANAKNGTASITDITVKADNLEGKEFDLVSGVSKISIEVAFHSDSTLPPPSVAVMFTDASSHPIASSGTRNDGFDVLMDKSGHGKVKVLFNKLPLLKGEYWLYVFLMCENAIHFYEIASNVAKINVRQRDLELGVVSLPHVWTDGVIREQNL